MATQTMDIASLADDQAYIRCQYDDVTRIASRVMWANLLTRPALCWATKLNGTALLVSQVIPAGTTEQSRNLTAQARFNVDTELLLVNLAA